MEKQYILAVDQSTQGTKAMVFDASGALLARCDLPHRQIINEKGWVSHDPEEIYANTLQVIKNVIEKAGIDKNAVAGLGISNQRETSLAWDARTGKPVADAIVWQCARAADLCGEVRKQGVEEEIREKTGIPLSPYYPASKYAWLLENIPQAGPLMEEGRLRLGTIDTWLIWCLTGGAAFKTDDSNASRTQLFNIHTLAWDDRLCQIFGIDKTALPEVCDSNACFGETSLNGYLDEPIPIRAALGDSHAALFGQGCLQPGMIKSTFGTGSSVMMQVGDAPVFSEHGAVTSLAWGIDGKVDYVLEGNVNYTGAVISWLKDDVHLIDSAAETEALARAAAPEDETYLVPAFTGLGVPYWDSEARGLLCGISRTTGKAELVKAALESIAYQVTDVVEVMRQDAGMEISELRVDGGPTRNAYLMQFLSDIATVPLLVPEAEELSGIGAAYLAGLSLGLYDQSVFDRMQRTLYEPAMGSEIRTEKYAGWKDAVRRTLS